MIIDAHTHIFPPEIVAQRTAWCERDRWFGQLYASPRAKLATADELVASMARAGIQTSFALAFGWSDPGVGALHNAYLLDAYHRFPGKLVPFAYATPNHLPVNLEEFAGIGEWMPEGQGFTLDQHGRVTPLLEAARALDLVVLTHVSEPMGHSYPGKSNVRPESLLALAEVFSENRFVAAHWGGGLPFFELMPEVREALSRVWYDTAAGSLLYSPQVFRVAERLLAPAKVLWGTDYPLVPQQRDLQRLHSSSISPELISRIAGSNSLQVLSTRWREAITI
ncbi:MAG: amidohydrolase [Chloroflexi bacterium]|nr:amidohydrolase [Chloroflexota bacterium]